MRPPRRYTAIVPRLDRTGPVNVAVELCRSAADHGAEVKLLYLSGSVERDDLAGLGEIRRLRLRDLFTLRGVVHTHCLRPDLLGAFLAAGRDRQVVTTLHNYFLADIAFDHGRWKTQLAYWAWARCVARFDVRVVLSGAMRRYYRRLLPGRPFDVAYNYRADGAASSELPAAVRTFIDAQRGAGRAVLAFVGSISRRKNVLPLARAVARSSRLSLVVCGGGPLEAELREISADPAARVHYVGVTRVPGAVIGAADALVLPSWAEGLPLVVIEALMCARPALLSNIAVHRELARLGAGITFDHRGFADLEPKALALAAPDGHPSPAEARGLYEREFSPGPGFERYMRLFARRDPAWAVQDEAHRPEGAGPAGAG